MVAYPLWEAKTLREALIATAVNILFAASIILYAATATVFLVPSHVD